MIMVDYSYYNGVYGGTSIKDPVEFRRYLFEAESLVNYYTMNRASGVNPDDKVLTEKVKMTVCFIIDTLYKEQDIGLVSSVSIEGISTSYANKVDRENAVSDLIEKFLGSTGLTYRGVMRCESYRQV